MPGAPGSAAWKGPTSSTFPLCPGFGVGWASLPTTATPRPECPKSRTRCSRSGLGLSANYGYTASGTSGIPGRSDHPRLLRMSPNAFNVSPTYDRGRLSLRVGLSYNQANIYSYQYTDCTGADSASSCTPTPGGVTGPLSDIYFYTHFQVDAQGSVRLG